jgi:putative membrane protein
MKKIKFIMLTAMQLVFPVLAFAHNDQYGMGPGMMGWGHSMGWPMLIFMFLFWGAMLAGIVALIRLVFSKSGYGGTQPVESALDILKKRYAKGEIDKEEFEEKKRMIEE